MQSLLKKWRRLQESQKNQVAILTVAVLVAAYAFFLFAPGKASLQWSQNMLSRQQNRMEIESQKELAELPDVASLYKKIDRLKAKLEIAKTRAEKVHSRQAPITDTVVLQNLRVGITNLALRSGLIVTSSRNAGTRAQDDEAPDRDEARNSLIRNAFGRPQIALKANANFSQLVGFLESLPELDYDVSVARMGMKVPTKSAVNYTNESFVATQTVSLDVDLLIAL